MKPSGANPRCLVGRLLLLGLALMVPLAAQNRLYVLEPDGNYHPVFKVSGDRPYIMDHGRLVAARGDRFALRKVEEYLPLFITVQDKAAGSTAMIPLPLGQSMPALLSSEFHFSARFESSYPLEDVFMVIEMETSGTGRNIVTCEIGSLAAWTPKPVVVNLPVEQNLGSGRLTLHLFVGGDEVMSTELPEADRERVLDRMIARRIAGVQQAGPRPLFGLAPAYPAELRQSGLKGEAVVKMRVTPQGAVRDVLVESATHPAFGLAALGVVPQWRFLPRVQGGRAVETRISLPLGFDPPADAGKN